ncbi:MAG: R3H domain-containing nucleic acid-binding protein [Dehalococcoidia bacterium]|nr:R3H domain-containing nucleic acid-binding protein [Dehalococcoidia bacterium]MDZ4246053.1 R3H domain-containing nucleic acid-binding protein [Dehalococcoidia bacterium]
MLLKTFSDLDALLLALPSHIYEPLRQQPDLNDLIEVVLDLGRPPEARFLSRELVLDSREVTEADLEHVTGRLSPFGDDNRAGIERTLHRISAIRNRKGRIVGLTCRVGRAVFGTIQIIRDLIESGQSVLLLGRPGVGKTTMLREVARVLADDLKKRVIIVDTSNEIAGDGDIPHPAIGHARRMQVATPTLQHMVMIEAVENHMPEVIVIDEIGTELEASAARTIAERGVQLVGTAHGNTLENLIMNPTLSDLLGGIQSVTLGDEEARRRGTQKSILERKAPPTFDMVIEIQDRNRVAVHPDVGLTVDNMLRGQQIHTEIRSLDENGEVKRETTEPSEPGKTRTSPAGYTGEIQGQIPRIYPFGVNRNRLELAAKEMKIPIIIVDAPQEANVLVTSKNYFRRKPQKIRDAEDSGVPIFVLRGNTVTNMNQCLSSITGIPLNKKKAPSMVDAISEAEEAIRKVIENGESVELNPQSAYIRRLQHILAERNYLSSSSHGQDPGRRVKIYKG